MFQGKIEVISGCMFAGKSEELIRRVKRAAIARKNVQVFNPYLNERYSPACLLKNHDGLVVEAQPVRNSEEIAESVRPETEVVAVDEVQFFDKSISDVATALANRGIRVILAGIDTDFRGEPFGPMSYLLAIADDVMKLHAICMNCGEPASRSQRLINGKPALYDSPTIMVGGRESYEARCRACFELPNAPPPKQVAAGSAAI